MIGVALALLGALGAGQGDAWAQLWTELERLRGGAERDGALDPAEAELLRSHLGSAASAPGAEPRLELLRGELDALSGRSVTALARRLDALQPSPFSARESWFLADLLPRGPERVRAVQAALQAPTSLQRWQALLAWNTAVDEARALRFEQGAVPIQLRLYQLYGDEGTAYDLAVSYKALGDRAAVEQVIREAIAREEAVGIRSPSLWELRGIAALAFGDEVRARDYLGKALALGSNDAGLLLSRLDLMAGRTEVARGGFRALILNQPPPDWAWRGWGMTLLPPPFAAPAERTPPNE